MPTIYETETLYKAVAQVPSKLADSPAACLEMTKDLLEKYKAQEAFVLIGLNRKLLCVYRRLLGLGNSHASIVDVPELFRQLLLTHVSQFIIIHNHPSGDPTPSDADRRMTKQIQEAAKLLGLRLCDHIIQGTKEDDPRGVGYYSFVKDDYSFSTRGRYGEND